MIQNSVRLLYRAISVYLFDINNFIKCLKSDNYNIKSIQNINKETDKIQIFSEKLLTKKTMPDIQLLKQITESFDLLLSELKILKCTDEILNEKLDLFARTFIIWEKCGKLLSFYNKNSPEKSEENL